MSCALNRCCCGGLHSKLWASSTGLLQPSTRQHLLQVPNPSLAEPTYFKPPKVSLCLPVCAVAVLLQISPQEASLNPSLRQRQQQQQQGGQQGPQQDPTGPWAAQENLSYLDLSDNQITGLWVIWSVSLALPGPLLALLQRACPHLAQCVVGQASSTKGVWTHTASRAYRRCRHAGSSCKHATFARLPLYIGNGC